MKKRTITGIVILLIFGPLLYLGGWFSFSAVCFLSYVASYELINLFSNKVNEFKRIRFVYPLFSVLIVVMVMFFKQSWLDLDDCICFFGFMIIISLLYCLFNKNLKMSHFGYLLITLIYGGLMFSTYVGIREMTSFGQLNNKYLGLYIFIYVTLVSFGTDIGAYTFGTLFGKHPFFHSISPKKSLEGSILGSLFGTLLGSVFAIIMYNVLGSPLDVLHIILLIIASYIFSMLSEFGDLIASKFKRDFDVKDYGTIFPGHGGVLDRFDSITFVATIVALLLMFLY